MEKSIMASGLIASNMLHANTITEKPERNEINNQRMETKITQAYKWSVKTEIGVFTGTCLSIGDVNKEIAMLTTNAKVLRKNIIPVSSVNEGSEDKIYTWNVISTNGQASGISKSLKEAQRVINSFGTTEVVNYNISESFTHQNNH